MKNRGRHCLVPIQAHFFPLCWSLTLDRLGNKVNGELITKVIPHCCFFAMYLLCDTDVEGLQGLQQLGTVYDSFASPTQMTTQTHQRFACTPTETTT